jgi:glycosyltransferase involved in cell wall biosynthesis
VRTISVIIPAYNRARELCNAIDSALAQTHPPLEIIIVDDGSTDDSRSVIERIAAANPSVRVIRHDANRGAIQALNTGLQIARARYVYFGAADDWVLPGFFERAIGMLEAYPEAGLFCSDAVLVDGHSSRPFALRPPVQPAYRTGLMSAKQTERLLRRIDNWIMTSSTVFRRDCITRSGGIDESLGPFGDGYLARKIALTHGFLYAPEICSCSTRAAGSYSQRTALDIDFAQRALRLIPERLAADPVFPDWYPRLFENRWRFATSRVALEADTVEDRLIVAMGGRTLLDRNVLQALPKILGRRAARLPVLAWLWLRLRPTSLMGLARTAIARRFRPSVATKLSR